MAMPIPRSPRINWATLEVAQPKQHIDVDKLQNEAEDWFTEIEQTNKKKFLEEANRKRFAHVFRNHVQTPKKC